MELIETAWHIHLNISTFHYDVQMIELNLI